MTETESKSCPSCSCSNPPAALRCERCGAQLESRGRRRWNLEPEQQLSSADVDASEQDEIDAVPSAERESLGEFENLMGADLAAGFLRAQGIAAEVGTEMCPGVPAREVWVSREDAAAARRLLSEVDGGRDSEDDCERPDRVAIGGGRTLWGVLWRSWKSSRGRQSART